MTEEQFSAAVLAGKGLIAAMHERDHGTARHLNRVASLSERLAQHLELADIEVKQTRATALYHDIGKIAVPDEPLFKPGPLSPAERATMQTHPEIGERILKATENRFLGSIAVFVRHHHERFDGSGYPDGLAGNTIPLVAQIVSIADAYDAIASERPYRPTQRHETTVATLAAEVGQKWNADLFDALVTMFEKGKAQ
jgi:putative nucleotidyltransferase with HDIG domain